MKTTFTLIIGIVVSLSIWAGSAHFASPYLLCEGTDTITLSTKVLKPKQVVNTTQSSTEKCTKIVNTDNKENTTKEKTQSISPNFLKLFFNFI